MFSIKENWIINSYLCLFNDELPGLLSDQEKKWILYHLSHQEEKDIKHRDQWNNFEASFSDYDKAKPYLDLFIKEKLSAFGLIQKSLWPEGKKFAFCISHDIDHIGLSRFQESQRFRLRRSPKYIYRIVKLLVDIYTKATAKDHPLWCYEEWVKFIKSVGYKSTFFVYIDPVNVKNRHKFDNLFDLNDTVRFNKKKMSVSEMILEIKNEGFEIGLHGSILSAECNDLYMEQKQMLESVIGDKIYVTRQHFLRHNIEVTPEVHFNSKVLVDSTLGFNKSIGFRAGTCMPYVLKSDGSNNLFEIPMEIMDGALFTTNALELNEDLAIKKAFKVMDYCEEVGGVLTINFHPNYISNLKWWSVFREIVMEAKKRNAYNDSLFGIARIALKGIQNK